jgi:amino acid transporter
VIVQFWVTVNNAVWVTVFSAILFASNIFLVRIYGEVEFTFAILKVCLVVGMNIMVLDLSLNSFDDGMLTFLGSCTHRRRRSRSPSHRL